MRSRRARSPGLRVPQRRRPTADALRPARRWPLGLAPSYMFHQPGLERALRAKLAADAPGRGPPRLALRGPRSSAGDAVRATRGSDGGDETDESARASWSAATARRSPVRKALDGGLFDYGFDEPWLVVDAREAGRASAGAQPADLRSRRGRRPACRCRPGPPPLGVHAAARRDAGRADAATTT